MAVPDGDKYFLGRAELGKGVELEPLEHDSGMKHKVFGSWASFFSTEFVPRGFLQMIYLDMNGFDRQHYKIEYIRREFLGEVRCLVFDVDPLPKTGKGRFGRANLGGRSGFPHRALQRRIRRLVLDEPLLQFR